MSTRCLIALKIDDGYKAIYCHHDGYLDGVGKTLVDHYDTAEKVEALLALGDILSLGSTLSSPPSRVPDRSCADACSRDGGEPFDGTAPELYHSLRQLHSSARNSADAEFLYVFENGVWSYLCPPREETLLQEVPK